MRRFYLLDLDFTLFKTREASMILIDEVSRQYPDVARLIEARLEEYAITGVSFAIRDQIVGQIGEQHMQTIENRYIERAQATNVLFDGAHEIMHFISEHGSRYAILTYGSVRGQTMKIRAAKLDHVPFLVTDHKMKGELIASWLQDGVFMIPEQLGGGEADEVVLVDDRVFSFKGLPEQTRGYWVQTGPVRYEPVEAAPDMVVTAGTLHDVIVAERRALDATD